jgi:hypothetical protein
VTELMMFGHRTNGAPASLRCSTRGQVAAVVKAVPAGTASDVAPPHGLSPTTATGSS